MIIFVKSEIIAWHVAMVETVEMQRQESVVSGARRLSVIGDGATRVMVRVRS